MLDSVVRGALSRVEKHWTACCEVLSCVVAVFEPSVGCINSQLGLDCCNTMLPAFTALQWFVQMCIAPIDCDRSPRVVPLLAQFTNHKFHQNKMLFLAFSFSL